MPRGAGMLATVAWKAAGPSNPGLPLSYVYPGRLGLRASVLSPVTGGRETTPTSTGSERIGRKTIWSWHLVSSYSTSSK